jgi:hypothetical protein
MTQVIAIDWADVKHRYIDSVRHGKRWTQAMQDTLDGLHAAPYQANEWAGGSGADTLGWLDDGYRAPEFADATNVVPTTEKVRVGWSEEDGDVDVGRLYGGYDDFYLATAPASTRPGLRVIVDCFFAALVKPKTVADYGAWVAGLIGRLEAQGYDLEVDLSGRVTQLYEGSKGRQDVEIRVKRSGELSDFTEWSALFAPTGTRHLVFTAFGVASEKVGKRQTSFMCMSLERSAFGVEYDEVENVLRITAGQRHGGAFPAEVMNEKLNASGLI